MNSNRNDIKINDIRRLIRPYQRRLPAGYSPDDHAQDVIVRLLRHPGEWSPQLVRTIARNLAADFARSAAFQKTRSWSHDGDSGRADLKDPRFRPPDDECAAQECRLIIRQHVARLGPRYREVVQRHFFDHESLRAIALDLGVSEETVRTRHKRAIAKLRDNSRLQAFSRN